MKIQPITPSHYIYNYYTSTNKSCNYNISDRASSPSFTANNTNFEDLTIKDVLKRCKQAFWRKPGLIHNDKERLKTCRAIIGNTAGTAGVIATAFAQVEIADAAALTGCTISMCRNICACYGMGFFSKAALIAAGIGVGKAFGEKCATYLVKYIPGVGNCANGLTTLAIHELTGWTLVAILENAYKSGTLKTIKLTKKLFEDNLKNGKKLKDLYGKENGVKQ